MFPDFLICRLMFLCGNVRPVSLRQHICRHAVLRSARTSSKVAALTPAPRNLRLGRQSLVQPFGAYRMMYLMSTAPLPVWTSTNCPRRSSFGARVAKVLQVLVPRFAALFLECAFMCVCNVNMQFACGLIQCRCDSARTIHHATS